MGIVRMGVPEELVLKLNSVAKLDTFIETGTFYGHTAAWAAKHFDHVFTIEIDKQISETAAANMGNSHIVNYLVGDSAKILPRLVTRKHSGDGVDKKGRMSSSVEPWKSNHQLSQIALKLWNCCPNQFWWSWCCNCQLGN
ncbi:MULTISPECIES: hypothetical protein [unclassified Moorena]|uniref:hypothetical protein n=1 Tax=unclassified Moorena TaxID=2683338 RepID=UPI0013C292A5|nr:MULTISPECIES: hypothetical protein [unclassified Moorena]NEP31285.1 class I SAM-dependent methyltransferase [Moorena sp. SIO3B2]NEQ12871.1 class I SAM-dependent methyltransferase [Moorena sp. SIO3E2]NES40566.1 class I SAM-dependent methyltransferase [Moorena sp. SIO2C4]